MNKKIFRPTIEFKEDDEKGSFRAIFSTFNVIDLDGDVTLPGAFTAGQKVRIAYWGHRWSDLPVGRGVVGADDEKAWVDGKFFMDTQMGLETYKTVKNLAELQEWSYGFDIDESESGQFEDQDVRFLKKLVVHEISPVMLGAGIGTMTTSIKGAKEREGQRLMALGTYLNDLDGPQLENGTASEDADQNGRPPMRSGTSLRRVDPLQLESEAGGDAGNESDVVSPETIQQYINLEMEIDNEN